MAARSFWKGYLKLSLVTCAVAMTPATSDAQKVRFHTLNRKTGNRVLSQFVDAVSNELVDEDDQAKGYPRGENDYVMLEDDEIDAVGLQSTRTIDIDMFVPATSIGWIWYDKPHYLAPDDKVGAEAFAVIRDAMASTRMVGISRLVMYSRERAVMLEPRGKGIVLWTLRYGDEVRDREPYFKQISQAKTDPKLMAMLKRVIAEHTGHWDPAMVSDPVQARLKAIIAARTKGGKRTARPKAEPPPPPAGNVVDIMSALRRSIAEGQKRGPR